MIFRVFLNILRTHLFPLSFHTYCWNIPTLSDLPSITHCALLERVQRKFLRYKFGKSIAFNDHILMIKYWYNEIFKL